jgi:beta-phosphoglucomutase family hydrolase
MASSDCTIAFDARAKALIFDLDGTVLDTMGHHWQAWDTIARKYRFELTKSTLFSMAGMPSTTIMDTLMKEQGLVFDSRAAALEKQKLYASLAVKTEQIPQVMNTAREAKRRGIPCAIATGGSRLQVEPAMKSSGIHEFFEVVVTCDDVTEGKPHPETFLKAAELLGVDPKWCVGFEDAPKGMEAIRNAGFLEAIDVTTFDWYPSV